MKWCLNFLGLCRILYHKKCWRLTVVQSMIQYVTTATFWSREHLVQYYLNTVAKKLCINSIITLGKSGGLVTLWGEVECCPKVNLLYHISRIAKFLTEEVNYHFRFVYELFFDPFMPDLPFIFDVVVLNFLYVLTNKIFSFVFEIVI